MEYSAWNVVHTLHGGIYLLIVEENVLCISGQVVGRK